MKALPEVVGAGGQCGFGLHWWGCKGGTLDSLAWKGTPDVFMNCPVSLWSCLAAIPGSSPEAKRTPGDTSLQPPSTSGMVTKMREEDFLHE